MLDNALQDALVELSSQTQTVGCPMMPKRVDVRCATCCDCELLYRPCYMLLQVG